MKIEKIKMGYLAVVLDPASRATLLEVFPPAFPDVIAHHVTVARGVPKPADDDLGSRHTIRIVGHAVDDSLETLVVQVDGRLQRADGKIYHITWSMDKATGRKAKESNDLIANGFTPVDHHITVMGELEFFYG